MKVAPHLPAEAVKVNMKLLIIFCVLTAVAFGAPASQSMDLREDGTYQFYYDTGPEAGRHIRKEEKGADGIVRGEFSYEDPTGDVRVVNYQADDYGYVAKGDVGVPGAPPGQFPAEPEVRENVPENMATETEKPEILVKEATGEVQKSTEEPPKKEEMTKDGTDDDDEIKAIKLEQPQEGGFPDGFPEGFFLQHFQGLRRLPDPKFLKKDVLEEKKQHQDMSAEEKPEKKEPDTKVPSDIFPFLPFHNFVPQSWSTSLFHPSMLHQPVYVYTYQKPDAYGYSYFY